MRYGICLVALSLVAAASPLSATQPDPGVGMGAPLAPPDARYCLHVGPLTGSLVETVECWTREEWVDQDVNIDKEWAKEGVAVLA